MLSLGALTPLGLGLPSLLRAGAAKPATGGGPSFGRAKRCLMLFMWGGPSHIDTFDMKPDAPAGIRGEFGSISTAVPGIRICEHLPKLAKHTDKIGFIRSVTHSDNNHSTGAHWMLTGHPHPLKRENFGAKRTDFPHIGSVIDHFCPPEALPNFVALPEIIGTTAGFVTPGQDGGFMGMKCDPFRINQHPSDPDFQVPNLGPLERVGQNRLNDRVSLLREFEQLRRELGATAEMAEFDSVRQRAVDMLSNAKVSRAFDLEAEGKHLRELYGMKPFGQSILLGRRLLEAGVKLVTVYWHRQQPAQEYSWDTHKHNFRQMKDRLLPQIDQPIAMLLEDLKQRGLLDETLVVWSSEFGRTPKVNANAGRDHWGKCNTVWMAGAGIPGGQLYGESDRIASEPVTDAVSPGDLSATIFHLLGIDPASHIQDPLQRPIVISDGKPLHRFIGA